MQRSYPSVGLSSAQVVSRRLVAPPSSRIIVQCITTTLRGRIDRSRYITSRARLTFLNSYEALRKTELELQLDEFLSENSAQFQNDAKLANYFTSRARTAGSPVKKDPELRVARRRATKAVEEIVAAE